MVKVDLATWTQLQKLMVPDLGDHNANRHESYAEDLLGIKI
jgi:hypothetical protein